jgi:hypothetical protein
MIPLIPAVPQVRDTKLTQKEGSLSHSGLNGMQGILRRILESQDHHGQWNLDHGNSRQELDNESIRTPEH